MAIKCSFKRVPVDETGKAYDSLEAFQAAELVKLLPTLASTREIGGLQAAEDIVSPKDEVIEILELTLDARPAARGVKKPRKPKTSAEAPIEPPPTQT